MEISNLRRDLTRNGVTRQGLNATVPPISHLPTELLAEIIRLALPSVEFKRGSLTSHADIHVTRIYAMRLIGKQWQGIIDGTPKFWTFIVSTLPPYVNEETIRRSGTGPLTIICEERGRYEGPSENWPPFEDFFGPLADTYPRWSAYSGPIVEEYLEMPAPHLQKIISQSSEGYNIPLELLGGSTAHLRHVDLSGVSIRWRMGIFTHLNALKLRSVEDGGLTTEHVLDILRASPCLEHLELSLMDVAVANLRRSQRISLPGLRFVRLYRCGEHFTKAILGQVQAPACIGFHVDVDLELLDIPAFINEDMRPFQELILVAHRRNGSSRISLWNNMFYWKGPKGRNVQDGLSFSVLITCNDLSLCMRWAESILLSDTGLSIEIRGASQFGQSVFEAIAPMRCVPRMIVNASGDVDDTLLALEFIGKPLSVDPSLPSLPCLQELLLESIHWNTQNLLETVHSRFNSVSWEGAERTPLTITIPPESVRYHCPGRILDLIPLVKIRETKGVERVQFVYEGGLEGRLAVTWDEETTEAG